MVRCLLEYGTYTTPLASYNFCLTDHVAFSKGLCLGLLDIFWEECVNKLFSYWVKKKWIVSSELKFLDEM